MLQKPNSKTPFIIALNLVKHLNSNGFKAYFAGGAVRDMLLGKTSRDFDIVTNAPMEVIPALFRGKTVKTVGKSFSVCIVEGVEVASCRFKNKPHEQYNKPGEQHLKDYTCHVQTHGTTTFPEDPDFPQCDLACRDLTINSMAFDPLSNTLIDPFAGQRDLNLKMIRFTGDPEERIGEDPLRMVRACRFISALQGTAAPSTLSAIRKNARLLMDGNSALERIQPEIVKAMTHKKPSLFFKALHTAGLLKLIFPSLNRCVDLEGGPHHGETVFEHCMMTGDALSPHRPLLRLAGYLHDTGKYDAAVIKEGQLTFAGHEKMGHQVIHDLEKLRFSISDIRYIDAVIKTHMRPLREDTTPRAVRRLLAFLKSHDITWQEFMRIRIADKSANLAKSPYTMTDIKVRISIIQKEMYHTKGTAFTLRDLALNGHEIMEILNIPPGKTVGKIMKQLFEMVLDNPELNRHTTLKGYLVESYKQRQ